MIKRLILSIFLFSISFLGLAQTKNGIWFYPSKAQKINGLSIGIFEEVSKGDSKQKNGIAISLIGTGIILGGPIIWMSSQERDWDFNNHYNGIALSLTGSFYPKVNGINASLFVGASEEVKGLSINLLASQINELKGCSIAAINISYSVRGVQFGIYNESNDLRGFQFGIWNKNEKRSLPFINWNFKK